MRHLTRLPGTPTGVHLVRAGPTARARSNSWTHRGWLLTRRPAHAGAARRDRAVLSPRRSPPSPTAGRGIAKTPPPVGGLLLPNPRFCPPCFAWPSGGGGAGGGGRA